MPFILALRSQWPRSSEFKANQGYAVRSYLKNNISFIVICFLNYTKLTKEFKNFYQKMF